MGSFCETIGDLERTHPATARKTFTLQERPDRASVLDQQDAATESEIVGPDTYTAAAGF